MGFSMLLFSTSGWPTMTMPACRSDSKRPSIAASETGWCSATCALEKCPLGDTDHCSEILLGVAADIQAAETDLAAVGVPETKDQAGQRALARAARPHYRNPAARPQNEGDVPQRRRTVFIVSEAHPVQRQRAVLWQGQGLGRVLDLGL